ncbi:hypothetical protein [Pseudomonas sp. UC 17F4]|uniref:hypothetical protein n=1 Tax=Pseudomonas sp. UC 17F4 TaxID=1855328 RepID=UPI00210B6969|nr:hypothetical protein [Pseudomonas sp. UC 17F4]
MNATGRSRSDFTPLTAAESHLQAHCKHGTLARFGSSRPTQATFENSIRADFLRFLLLGGDRSAPVHECGVQLAGAYIVGTLDLRSSAVPRSMTLSDCMFSDSPNFTDSKVCGSLVMSGCSSPGLEAERLDVRGAVNLSEYRCFGPMNLRDAQVGGSLYLVRARLNGRKQAALFASRVEIAGSLVMTDLIGLGMVSFQEARISGEVNGRGARLNGKGAIALLFAHAQVDSSVRLSDEFKAKGVVVCLGMKVEGVLDCSNSMFDGKGEKSLFFNEAWVKGNVCLNSAFTAKGSVCCQNARIDGQLNLEDASLNGMGESALDAEGLKLRQDLDMKGDFAAIGEIRLLGARIDGQLVCEGRIEGQQNVALFADGVGVAGGVFFSKGFHALGEVRLVRARIDGQLNFNGGVIDGQGSDALSADGMVLQGDLFLHRGFKATGAFRLMGAQIDGGLMCGKAELEGDEDISLAAARVEVKGQVRLGDGFHAHKAVSFDGARLAGSFDCSRARFADEKKVSLDLEGMHLEGPLILRALDHPLSNATFAGARVGELDDDEDTWGDNIVLNGLDYQSLAASAPVNAAFRVAWLGKQVPALSLVGHPASPGDDFRPQPWRHLQHVFENMGHTAEAREVGVAFERKLRDIGHIGQPPQNWWKWTHPIYTSTARGLHWLYGRLTGFGYRPMQLLVWFLAIWLICAGFYWYAASQQRVFGPSNPLVFQHDAYFDCRPDRGDAWRQANPGLETPPTYYGNGNWYLCQTLREEYTGFSPLAYSLDVLMPLVDLQQESDWAPLVPTPKQGYWDEFISFGWKHFVRLLIWFEILVGWGISLLMVAIVSGLARRSE